MPATHCRKSISVKRFWCYSRKAWTSIPIPAPRFSPTGGNRLKEFLGSKSMQTYGREIGEKLSQPIVFQWSDRGRDNPVLTVHGYPATLRAFSQPTDSRNRKRQDKDNPLRGCCPLCPFRSKGGFVHYVHFVRSSLRLPFSGLGFDRLPGLREVGPPVARPTMESATCEKSRNWLPSERPAQSGTPSFGDFSSVGSDF
jgi:hypothetical protein